MKRIAFYEPKRNNAVKQASEYLQMDEQIIYKLVRKGLIPSLKIASNGLKKM